MRPEKDWLKDVIEASEKLDSTDVQWVDVREPDEYKMFRIPGTTLIPMDDVLERLDELEPDKELIVVCFSGARSGEVTAQLRQRGFNRAYNLKGGMVAWAKANLPIERG